MSEYDDQTPSGGGERSHTSAKQIADQITPLIRVARSEGSDFLAYLLAMAQREARRLSRNGDKAVSWSCCYAARYGAV